MSTTYRVTYVRRGNPCELDRAILDIGGPGWRVSQRQAIRQIERGRARFCIDRGARPWRRVVVAVSADGRKYLRTEGDDERSNDLLSLPELRVEEAPS